MANNIKLDWSELKYMQRDLLSLSRVEKNKAIRDGFRKGANQLRDEIKRLAPVDTGTLKKDIRSSATSKGGFVYIVGNRLSAEKANWIEYGTSNMTAKPFIRVAFDSNQEKIEKICINGIIGAIDQEFMK